MKKLVIILMSIMSVLLVGCSSSSSSKILNIVELNKTSEDEIIGSFNLEIESTQTWDETKGIYVYNYIWHYADYTLNNVDGVIRIRFEDETAQFVNYSAEATSENMEQLLSYLVDTYGKNYEKVDGCTTRWTSNNLIIDYVLTDENTIEVRWYNE